MFSRYAKVSEIAERFRVSADAVYLWIRQGKIPADCVIRIAGTVRIDEEQFEERLRSGALYRRPGRKRTHAAAQPAPLVAEDSLTTGGPSVRQEHEWMTEDGDVRRDHPFSPEMIRTEM